MLQYQIETNLLDVLRNDWQSPENQQVALMTFDALFKLTEQCPENTYKEGTKYQENFMNKGGLEQLECLQEDGSREIYELSNRMMAEYFPSNVEEDDMRNDTNNPEQSNFMI